MPDNTEKNQGLTIALGTIAAAVSLFVPLPGDAHGDGGTNWLSPVEYRALFAMALAAGGFWAFAQRFLGDKSDGRRSMRNGVALVVTQAILLRAAIEFDHPEAISKWLWWPESPWVWTPWFFVTGLAVMLLGSRASLLLALTGVFLLYLRADPGALALVGCLVSSLLGIALLRRPTRGRILRAGVGAGVLLGVVALVDAVIAGAPYGMLGATAAVPVLLGAGSAFLLLAFLPIIEWLLGELSDVTLVEYGGDHPLLDELKQQAPGTWHHTLNVADLAEKAAAAIGARTLLCRTSALYHDIGKLKDPGLFAENITGPSPHDLLDPRASGKIIIDHVGFGMELARKHRLPKAFQQVIAEHHGTSLVRFFYASACRDLRPGEDPESLRAQFSYPGPRPSSRESGLIAMADIIEAGTRSLGPTSEAESRDFVRKLIAERVAEGELSQCPLTLPELARVEETFIQWVKVRHHSRPTYPSTPVAGVMPNAGQGLAAPNPATLGSTVL